MATDGYFRRWGAVWILITMWVISLAIFSWSEYLTVMNDAAAHGQVFEWSDYWPRWWAELFSNLQSEWAQLALQALLISAYANRLFRKGTEDQRRLEVKVDALLRRTRM